MQSVVISNMKFLTMEEIIVFFPKNGYCIVKCIIFLTGGDHKQQ